MWEVKPCLLEDVAKESTEGWEPFAVTERTVEREHPTPVWLRRQEYVASVWLRRRVYVEPKNNTLPGGGHS